MRSATLFLRKNVSKEGGRAWVGFPRADLQRLHIVAGTFRIWNFRFVCFRPSRRKCRPSSPGYVGSKDLSSVTSRRGRGGVYQGHRAPLSDGHGRTRVAVKSITVPEKSIYDPVGKPLHLRHLFQNALESGGNSSV